MERLYLFPREKRNAFMAPLLLNYSSSTVSTLFTPDMSFCAIEEHLSKLQFRSTQLSNSWAVQKSSWMSTSLATPERVHSAKDTVVKAGVLKKLSLAVLAKLKPTEV